jgi:hypothetical protein
MIFFSTNDKYLKTPIDKTISFTTYYVLIHAWIIYDMIEENNHMFYVRKFSLSSSISKYKHMKIVYMQSY